MRVALVDFTPNEYSFELANGLADGADVLLVAARERCDHYAKLLDARVAVHPYDLPRLRRADRQIAAMAGVVRAIHRYRPHVVHLQMDHPWFSLALPALRRYPLVLTVHDPVPHLGDRPSARKPRWLVARDRRRASAFVIHADALRADLIAGGVDPARVWTIPHVALGLGVRPTPVPPGPPQILFFGRIWPYKGLDVLIRAAPAIGAAVPDARFVIAGRGEDFARYRAMMHDPGRYDVHNRYIAEDEVDAFFDAASVVVLPYVDASQSGVVSLAYSHARAVVATAVGGLPEVVDDGRTGRLVLPGDVDALAAAVVEVIADRRRADELGRAGREKLERECAPSVVGRRHLELYDAVLTRAGRR